MATAPFQPIPDSTQPYVDRLVGAQVGELRVVQHVGEGRYGTLYRCEQLTSRRPAMLEVLRTGLKGNDDEVRAVNAIKVASIPAVSAFGELPDGRRYRVMEFFDGEPLDQVLLRRQRLAPRETAQLLARVAGVLEAAHAWALAHGCLGPSSVFVVGDAVKLVDFGLAKQAVTPADDLKALGTLGFTLLTGQDFTERAPPALDHTIPELLDRVLRELIEGRLEDATGARKELEGLLRELTDVPAAETRLVPLPPRTGARALVLLAVVAVLAAAGGAAFFSWPGPPEPELPVVAAEEDDSAFVDDPADEVFDEVTEEPPTESVEPSEASPTRPQPKTHRPVRRVPTAEALKEQIWRLEARLRKEARPGDDVEQALYVLNKQRLRLTGTPSVADRREVAHQLAGWRRNYLR